MKRLGFITGAIIVFLWSPLVFIFAKGLNAEAFAKLWGESEILWALGQSLLLAAATCVFSTFLGTLTAFAMPRLGVGMRKWVNLGLFIPMVLPEIAFGISYLVWYIKLGLSLGWITLFMSHVAFTFCYAVLVMKTRVDAFDSSLLDAGRDLGANRLRLFRHAVLPQLTPALVASAVMTFSLSLDDFLISFFVKGLDQVTLPIKIYSMMKLRIGAEVYALSVVLLTLSLISVMGTQIWYSRSSRSVL